MNLQDTYKPEDKDLEPVSAAQRSLITPLTSHKRRCSLEKDWLFGNSRDINLHDKSSK